MENTDLTFIEQYPIFFSLGILLILLLVGMLFLLNRYRKKSEEGYITANKWMMELLSSMPDMAVIFDSDLKVTDIINPLENVLLGMSVDDLRGVKASDFGKVNPIFINASRLIGEHVEKTHKTKQSFIFKYEVVVNGETRYAWVRTTPFGNNNVICFTHDETDQVIAEQKVLWLKTFFQSIVDNIPYGILVKDVDNEFRSVFFNNFLLDFFGDDISFKLGENDIESGDPRAELYLAEDRSVLEDNAPKSFERISYDPKTGKPVRWEVTTKTCFTIPGDHTYLIALTVETTDMKKREFELQSMKQELSLALEAGNISAWHYDMEKERFFTLYGNTHSDEAKTIEDILELLHPEDREKYNKMISDMLTGKFDKRKYVFRFQAKESYRWIESYVITTRSKEDGEVYQIIGTERDITEEIEKQRELVEANSKLELAFSSAEIMPWEIDMKTKVFSSINPQSFESKGMTLDNYHSYIHRDDLGIFITGFENIINGKKKMMDVQIRITFPGEEQRWYELSAIVSNRDKNGNVSRVVGLRRDITAQKMTDELIELREKAENANRMKSAFLANMSHEIRTPLNAIVGFSQLIMQTDDDQEKESYREIIEANNDLLLQLISDILDISKIEAGELDFIYSGFEVNTIFQNMAKVYVERVKENVRLICNLPEKPCMIYSDKTRLTQVISNFLSNASKFTSEGEIEMGYSYTDSGLRFFVRDTGTGIEEKNLKAVFDRFSKFNSFVQGTGLGLSISQSIVEYLGGEIGVISEPGKGSEFWFTIPCDPVIL